MEKDLRMEVFSSKDIVRATCLHVYQLHTQNVFCKHFLDKIAKYFWTLLHVQIGQSCNDPTGCAANQPQAIADII